MAVEAALEHVVEIGIDAGMDIIDAGEFCVFHNATMSKAGGRADQ